MTKYVTIKISYGIGYGSHETDMEVPVESTDEEIHDLVWDMLAERLDFGWERLPVEGKSADDGTV